MQWPVVMVRSQDFAISVQENMLAHMLPTLYSMLMASHPPSDTEVFDRNYAPGKENGDFDD
jgi:hypothetical protein